MAGLNEQEPKREVVFFRSEFKLPVRYTLVPSALHLISALVCAVNAFILVNKLCAFVVTRSLFDLALPIVAAGSIILIFRKQRQFNEARRRWEMLMISALLDDIVRQIEQQRGNRKPYEPGDWRDPSLIYREWEVES